jgi:serine phosphatase RsbU (regulator of sigma subunit)
MPLVLVSSSIRKTVVTGVVAVIALVSIAALLEMLSQPPAGLIPQGPAAVATHLEEDLAVFFSPDTIAVAQRALHFTGSIVFITLATVLAWRRGGSGVAALAAVALVTLGAALFAPLTLLPGGDSLAQLIGAMTPTHLAGFWGSLAGITTLAFLGIFPDGRWLPGWSKWPVLIAAVSGVAAWIPRLEMLNPHSWPWSLQIVWLIALPVTAMTAQIFRNRLTPLDQAAKPVVVSLAAALGAFLLLWLIQPELSPGALDLVVVTPRLRAVFAMNILFILTVAVFLFPVSVSFAIVKHRLFDLDLLVNRTLVYGTVTALVALVFLALALGIATVARVPLSAAVDGWAAGPVGVVLGTMVVLVFQPLRNRVQHAVDRRFYRERYDARQIIDRFAGDAARVVDPARFEDELISVVNRALRPKVVRLHTGLLSEEMVGLVAGGMTVDLADPSRRRSESEVGSVLVPLVAGGSLAGILELGPRSSASRYSALDLELLDRLAQTAGPALKLAYEVRAREREAQELERNAHELELARKIQQGLLPHDLPQVDGWSFGACYRPAREVGGDFYDWLVLPDGRLVLVIGDVSDKGIPAALVMATCRTLIRVAVGDGRPPGEVLAEVNDRLQPDIPAGMFVTCLVAVVDPSSGDLVLANAGHNLPFRRSEASTIEMMARGMPLGLMPGMVYDEVTGTLLPGESLVLTSDGLAESHSPDGEMYGTERLRDALGAGTEDLVAAALGSHERYVGSVWEQEDDITIFTVARDAEPNELGSMVGDAGLEPVTSRV